MFERFGAAHIVDIPILAGQTKRTIASPIPGPPGMSGFHGMQTDWFSRTVRIFCVKSCCCFL